MRGRVLVIAGQDLDGDRFLPDGGHGESFPIYFGVLFEGQEC